MSPQALPCCNTPLSESLLLSATASVDAGSQLMNLYLLGSPGNQSNASDVKINVNSILNMQCKPRSSRAHRLLTFCLKSQPVLDLVCRTGGPVAQLLATCTMETHPKRHPGDATHPTRHRQATHPTRHSPDPDTLERRPIPRDTLERRPIPPDTDRRPIPPDTDTQTQTPWRGDPSQETPWRY